MDQILEKLKNKQDLTFEESKTAFEILMTGKASDDEIFTFLTLLSLKGEVSEEIAGGVYILREKSKRVNVQNCVDTCGTGGDGMNSLNISTASALLLASMGIKVAKHGKKNGILHHAGNQPETDTEAQEVKKQSRQTIESDVDNLIGDGRVKQYRRIKGGEDKWLGTTGTDGKLFNEELNLNVDRI